MRTVAGAPARGWLRRSSAAIARAQLANAERLGDVVVGAGLEAEHLLGLLRAGGQHQDRRAHAAAPQLAADFEAVFARQHDVEQDRVERCLARPLQRRRGRRWMTSTW